MNSWIFLSKTVIRPMLSRYVKQSLLVFYFVSYLYGDFLRQRVDVFPYVVTD